MKAAKFLAASTCLLTLSAAPALAENATVGVEAGVTASRFSPSPDGESVTLGGGAIAGFYVVVPILKSVSFVPELVYVQRYASRTTAAGAGSEKIEYVQIPLLAKMPFYFHTYISEGVTVSFPVHVVGASQSLSQTTSPDIGIVIGGGTDLGKFAIEFRYDGGVRRVSTRDTDPIQRTRSFMLLVKLHF